MSEEINKNEIYSDLIELFIKYQWQLENPMSNNSEEEKFAHYRSDQFFNRKVRGLASGVMVTLDKHL